MTSHIKCDILFTWMVSEMIAELSKRMSLFLCKKEIVEQEMAEVYQYGFEIIFSTLIGFFITIAIGAVFRMFLVSLVYYFAFVALRLSCEYIFEVQLDFCCIDDVYFRYGKNCSIWNLSH